MNSEGKSVHSINQLLVLTILSLMMSRMIKIQYLVNLLFDSISPV